MPTPNICVISVIIFVCMCVPLLYAQADFKTELSQSDILDNRVKDIIVKIVDVQYGGENGFNQVLYYAMLLLLPTSAVWLPASTFVSHRCVYVGD